VSTRLLRAGAAWTGKNFARLVRVMQNYCSEHKKMSCLPSARLAEGIEENVFPDVYAPNPHMLVRVLEDFNILYCDRLVIESSLHAGEQ